MLAYPVLRTFASAHTMSNVLLRNPSEQRKAAKTAAAGRGTNGWGDNKPLRGLWERGTRGAARSLFIYVCEQEVIALRYE